MTRREKLQEAYEDALFALLMEDVIEHEGQHLVEKNARLRANPDAEIPAELDERCRNTIRRKHGQRQRRETGLSFHEANEVINKLFGITEEETDSNEKDAAGTGLLAQLKRIFSRN